MNALQTGAIEIGPLLLSKTVLLSWLVSGGLVWAAWWWSARPKLPDLSRADVVAEGIIYALLDTIEGVLPEHAKEVLPFIGTLMIFLVSANLLGLVPGLSSPTADLSVTAALAFLVFLSVHWFGIKLHGARRYFSHYLSPSPIMLPFHIIAEATRTLALAVRLFGNMMSLELTAVLVLLVAGFLAPVPILMLHIVEALVQAFIFTTLALVYIGGVVQSQAKHEEELPCKK